MGVFQSVSSTFRQMTLKEHLVYYILPIMVSWTLAFIYFAGPRWMQDLVAHSYNREFGLLENLENLLLLLIIIISFTLLRRSGNGAMKIIYMLCLLASVFMLLEEIDYGYHFWNYFNGIRPQDDLVIHNIHNQGKNTIKILMWVCYAIILLFIMIMPHLKKDRLPVWIMNLIPSIKLHFTVLSIPLISRIPHILNNMNFETNQSLYHNLSEFEELAIYYVFFLFFYEMKSRLLDQELFKPGHIKTK